MLIKLHNYEEIIEVFTTRPDTLVEDRIKFERHQWTRLHQWTVGSRVVVTNYGPAVITKLNKNGTYAVNYDAGGSYSSVCPTQCRRPEDL